MNLKNAGIAAAAAAFVIGSAGTPALAVASGDSPGNSAADIDVNNCVIESSKDISYIEYYADGQSVTKDETVDSETFDLASVQGIEDVETIDVKAGTTVESFAVSCGDDGLGGGAGTGDDGTTDDGTTDDGTTDDGTTDEGTTEDGTTDDGTTEDGLGGGAGTGDGDTQEGSAEISLNGCVLNSTKDISNIEYYSDGFLVSKDESMNTTTYDLTTVEGIEDIDAITVKSSETIESFNIDCA